MGLTQKEITRMRRLDRLLLTADSSFTIAEAKVLSALRRAFYPGRYVNWKHGDHYLAGNVVEVHAISYHHARIRIRSESSGKTYDVTAGRIISEL